MTKVSAEADRVAARRYQRSADKLIDLLDWPPRLGWLHLARVYEEHAPWLREGGRVYR